LDIINSADDSIAAGSCTCGYVAYSVRSDRNQIAAESKTLTLELLVGLVCRIQLGVACAWRSVPAGAFGLSAESASMADSAVAVNVGFGCK